MDDQALLQSHGFPDAQLIARGGAARVYRAGRDGKDLALKLVGPELASQLSAEARALRQVGPPVAPELYAAHSRLLVLEWLEGQTLAHWVQTSQPAEARAQVSLRLSSALAHVHRAGLVHRDVKGSNVMVTPSGEVRLFDFGLASEGQAVAARRQGTATAMAPEAWEGGAVGAPADVYALGVLLFEVLTGRPLFTGDASQLEAAHRQVRAPAAGLGDAIDGVLARCLEKSAGHRYPDAGEVHRALSAALALPAAMAAAEKKTTLARAPVLTALAAVEVALPLTTLARALEAEGAVWAGTVGSAQLFARPHPLGPALGLAHLEAGLAAVGAVERVTLHVAPLTVRVGSASVRFSGSALQQVDWVAAERGRSVSAAAAVHLSGRSTRPLENGTELPWLEDGSRLTPVLAALAQPQPQLIWVQASSGSGRTRLLQELERALTADGRRVVWIRPELDLQTLAAGGVLLVDDAEQLGWEAWEAIEISTAPGAVVRCDVVVAGDERLPVLRPGLGSRAAAFVTIAPKLLSEAEAAQLVRTLLAPAELVPAEVVERLARAGEGHAGHLVELVDVLRRRGVLAPDARTGEWRLASEATWSELGGARTATLARAALTEVPSGLHDVARLLALAQWPLSEPELQRALSVLPATFEARRFDAAAALARLRSLGVLSSTRFAQSGMKRALAAQPGPRAVELHRALAEVLVDQLGLESIEDEVRRALEALDGLGSEERPRFSSRGLQLRALANHSHAAGWREVARLAAMAVGLRALSDGDALTAEGQLTRALAFADHQELRLARARARRQLEQFSGALADARAVSGQGATKVAAHLEASLALDWMNEFAQANEEAEAALKLGAPFEAAPTPLGRELKLARGRLHVRAGQWAEATEVLTPLCSVEPRPAEVETILGAFALAGSVACVEGALDRSEALFARGLALSERGGRPVVGCALLINRPMLWMAKGELEAALADFAEAARSSRRLGHAQIERVASHNLAQYLLWLGRIDEAETLARRAVTLARLRLGTGAPPADALLLARVAVAKGERTSARALLGQVGDRSLNPSEALQRDVVRAWLGDSPWRLVLAEREGVVPDELLDAALLAKESDPAMRADAQRVIEKLAPLCTALLWSRVLAPRGPG